MRKFECERKEHKKKLSKLWLIIISIKTIRQCSITLMGQSLLVNNIISNHSKGNNHVYFTTQSAGIALLLNPQLINHTQPYSASLLDVQLL